MAQAQGPAPPETTDFLFFQQRHQDIFWKNAIRGEGHEGFDDKPSRCACRAVHQIDRTLAVVYPGVFPSTSKIEPQAGDWFVACFKLGTLHLGAKVEVDGGAIDDFRNLIILIVVIEDVAVQCQRAIEQRVLGTQLERIDEFRLEGKRMIGLDSQHCRRW